MFQEAPEQFRRVLPAGEKRVRGVEERDSHFIKESRDGFGGERRSSGQASAAAAARFHS